jgi:hypothetical protein
MYISQVFIILADLTLSIPREGESNYCHLAVYVGLRNEIFLCVYAIQVSLLFAMKLDNFYCFQCMKLEVGNYDMIWS